MYQIQLTRQAEKSLDDLMSSQPNIARRVVHAIDELGKNANLGLALRGKLKGLYKYRVGSYRIIYQIYRKKLLITVLDLGHRKEIYR